MLKTGFGAKITEYDPGDSQFGEDIRQLIYRHKLVSFSGKNMSAEEYVNFSRKIGKPHIYLQSNYHHEDHPEIFISSNTSVNGKEMGVPRTGGYWHADTTFEASPQSFSMIFPQILPKGERSTCFIDLTKAKERIPTALYEKIRQLYTRHDGNGRYKIKKDDIHKSLREILEEITSATKGAEHPLILKHPATHEEIVFISSGFTSRILDISVFESQEILSNLFQLIESKDAVEIYNWEEDEIVIWDNLSLIHRTGVMDPKQDSMMFRIGLFDESLKSLSTTGKATSALERVSCN